MYAPLPIGPLPPIPQFIVDSSDAVSTVENSDANSDSNSAKNSDENSDENSDANSDAPIDPTALVKNICKPPSFPSWGRYLYVIEIK